MPEWKPRDNPPNWVRQRPDVHLTSLHWLPPEVSLPFFVGQEPLRLDRLGIDRPLHGPGVGFALRFQLDYGNLAVELGPRAMFFFPDLSNGVPVQQGKSKTMAALGVDLGLRYHLLSRGRVLPFISAHGGLSSWWLPIIVRSDRSVDNVTGGLLPLVGGGAGVSLRLGPAEGSGTTYAIELGGRVEYLFARDLMGKGQIFDSNMVLAYPFVSFRIINFLEGQAP